jgi:hypothetical protein
MAIPTSERPHTLDTWSTARPPAPAAREARGGAVLINPKTKRVTIPVSRDIDLIRDRLAADTGIVMSYSQIFNFLIHFYVERASEPKSKWRSLS